MPSKTATPRLHHGQRKPRLRLPPVSPYGHTGCNESCLMWRRCVSERLWAGPELLPCEAALDDEIGMEYEPGELTLWPVLSAGSPEQSRRVEGPTLFRLDFATSV